MPKKHHKDNTAVKDNKSTCNSVNFGSRPKVASQLRSSITRSAESCTPSYPHEDEKILPSNAVRIFEEAEALQAIYGEESVVCSASPSSGNKNVEMTISNLLPATVDSIVNGIGGWQHHFKGRCDLPSGWEPVETCKEPTFAIVVFLPHQYPEGAAPVVLTVREWWLTSEDCIELQKKLNKHISDNFIGSEMLFEVAEMARQLIPVEAVLSSIEAEALMYAAQQEAERNQLVGSQFHEIRRQAEQQLKQLVEEPSYTTEGRNGGIGTGKDKSVSHLFGIDIFHGEPVVDRKSVFQAHLAVCTSLEQVEDVKATLYSYGKVARAAHNITCYRIKSAVIDEGPGAYFEDHDSDGETAAGGRLQHLFNAAMVEPNTYVVVTRWFGGILLGPDRFRHINNVARELLEEHGRTRRNKKR